MSIIFNEVLRFNAFGDWGHSTPSLSSLFTMLKEDERYVDFCVLLGDNFYPNGVSGTNDERWIHDVLTRFPKFMRLYAIIGNHDYHSNPSAQIMFTYNQLNTIWKMPFLFYDEVFDIGSDTLHLICIDTQLLSPMYTLMLLHACNVTEDQAQTFIQIVNEFRCKQLQWLEERLQHSTSKYKIVCGHYPIISNGPHAVDQEFSELLHSLLEMYSVDVYISGHDHNAQVIQHGNVLCIISGATSVFVPPPRILHKNTRFVSDTTGYFQFEATPKHLKIFFVSYRHKFMIMTIPTK